MALLNFWWETAGGEFAAGQMILQTITTLPFPAAGRICARTIL
jgi:hypothetical protein